MVSDFELSEVSARKRWATAESNVVYFIVSGIAFARSAGRSAGEFGVFCGQVADWEDCPKNDPSVLIRAIHRNKLQFKLFKMEVLSHSPECIEARMKGFGEEFVRRRRGQDISVDDYIEFFENKWATIANKLCLIYRQNYDGEWVSIKVIKQCRNDI